MGWVLGHAAGWVALGLALWLSGEVLLRRLDLGRPDLGLDGLRHPARFCLGLAFWAASLFALAAVGLLSLGGLALPALTLVVLAVLPRRRDGGAEAARHDKVGTGVGTGADAAMAAFFALVLGFSFLVTIGPTVFWDADVYHLALPKIYLAHGGFRPVEMSVYSNWPLLTELFYAAAMLVHDYVLAKSVHLGFGVLVVFTLAAALRDEERRSGLPSWGAAWVASALFLANDVVAFELQVAYVELAQAFFFLAGFLFLHRSLEDDDPARARGWLLLAGLSGGLLAGVKVQGIASAAILGVLYLPRLGAADGRRAFLSRFALPVAAGWTPWLVKSAWSTGNPVYPFLYRVFGGPDWSPELGERFAAWQASIGMGRGLTDTLLLPLRVILEGGRGYERFDGEIGAFWIVAVPLAFFAWRRPLARRALGVAGLAFVFWAATSQQMRFLVPVLPLLALATALALGELGRRLAPPARRWAAAGVLAGAVALVLFVHAPVAAGGWRNLQALVRFEGDPRQSVVPAEMRFVNEHLPEDARILFLNVNRRFFCDREALADSFFEASQIAAWLGSAESPAEVRRRLEARGVTHVLLDRRPYVDWPPVVLEWLADPIQTETLFEAGPKVVLRLR